MGYDQSLTDPDREQQCNHEGSVRLRKGAECSPSGGRVVYGEPYRELAVAAEVRQVLRERRQVVLRAPAAHAQLQALNLLWRWGRCVQLSATLRLLRLQRVLRQQGFPLRKVGILQGREGGRHSMPVLLQLLLHDGCAHRRTPINFPILLLQCFAGEALLMLLQISSA